MSNTATDTERLDWLEPRLGLLAVLRGENGETAYGFDRMTLYPTLREAIDAAMKQEHHDA